MSYRSAAPPRQDRLEVDQGGRARLNRGPGSRYEHDGAGGVHLVGGVLTRPVRMSLQVAEGRLEYIEAARARVAADPDTVLSPDWYDAITASLLLALERAEAWRRRRRQAQPGNPLVTQLGHQ